MCAPSWRKQRPLVSEPTWSWGTTTRSAEETRLSVPDGDDRGPLTRMAESEGDRSKKRLAGESVDSGSSSVIGTSSHSIEPHSDDETERRFFLALPAPMWVPVRNR